MILTFAMGGLQMGFFQIQWNVVNDVYVNFKKYDARINGESDKEISDI